MNTLGKKVVDLDKPYTTRSGHKAVYLGVTGAGFHAFGVEDDNKWYIRHTWGPDFNYRTSKSTVSPSDIVNVPDKKSVFYNIYSCKILGSFPYSSLEAARGAASNREPSLGVVEVILEDGVMTSSIVHPKG